MPGPIRNPEIEGEKCAGAVAVCTMDYLQGYWQYLLLAEEAREYFMFMTGDVLSTPTRVPQGVMNATSYFQGMMMEVFRNLVGRTCLIYVDNVKIIGRSVEELIVNLRTILLRYGARVVPCSAQARTVFQRDEMVRQTLLEDGRQTRPRARAWTGGNLPTRDGGQADEVSAGNDLDAFVTASYGGSCGNPVSVDGTSTEGNEPNENRGVAAGANGW